MSIASRLEQLRSQERQNSGEVGVSIASRLRQLRSKGGQNSGEAVSNRSRLQHPRLRSQGRQNSGEVGVSIGSRLQQLRSKGGRRESGGFLGSRQISLPPWIQAIANEERKTRSRVMSIKSRALSLRVPQHGKAEESTGSDSYDSEASDSTSRDDKEVGTLLSRKGSRGRVRFLLPNGTQEVDGHGDRHGSGESLEVSTQPVISANTANVSVRDSPDLSQDYLLLSDECSDFSGERSSSPAPVIMPIVPSRGGIPLVHAPTTAPRITKPPPIPPPPANWPKPKV